MMSTELCTDCVNKMDFGIDLEELRIYLSTIALYIEELKSKYDI